jgi:hypothetical protein
MMVGSEKEKRHLPKEAGNQLLLPASWTMGQEYKMISYKKWEHNLLCLTVE